MPYSILEGRKEYNFQQSCTSRYWYDGTVCKGRPVLFGSTVMQDMTTLALQSCRLWWLYC